MNYNYFNIYRNSFQSFVFIKLYHLPSVYEEADGLICAANSGPKMLFGNPKSAFLASAAVANFSAKELSIHVV